MLWPTFDKQSERDCSHKFHTLYFVHENVSSKMIPLYDNVPLHIMIMTRSLQELLWFLFVFIFISFDFVLSEITSIQVETGYDFLIPSIKYHLNLYLLIKREKYRYQVHWNDDGDGMRISRTLNSLTHLHMNYYCFALMRQPQPQLWLLIMIIFAKCFRCCI